MVGCLLMGLMANLPIALAPGMGMVSQSFERERELVVDILLTHC